MKRVIALFIALMIAFTLSGCNSTDYKKALALYEKGDYLAARELFEELDGYEDSADQINACNYQLALECMEDGEYEQAKEMFIALGKFEDSPVKANECIKEQALACMDDGKYAKAFDLLSGLEETDENKALSAKAARYMLLDYLDGLEEPIHNISEGSGCALMESDGMIGLGHTFKVTGLIENNASVVTIIDPEEGAAVVKGEETMKTHAANYQASAEKTLDIGSYTSGLVLEWDEFTVKGTTAQGTPYTRDTCLLDLRITVAVRDTTALLAKALEESELGITINDLGFYAY